MNAADFAGLETEINEAPEFFVEPRDSNPASEFDRQREFVRKARARGMVAFAIPNARSWGMKAWNKAKAEGCVWGAPDLVVMFAGRTAFIEMKNGRAMPEGHQVDCLNRLHRMGFPVGVFRTAECALGWLVARGFGEVLEPVECGGCAPPVWVAPNAA